MKKKTRTICAVCKKLRIVTTWGASKSEIAEIKNRYICSDHEKAPILADFSMENKLCTTNA